MVHGASGVVAEGGRLVTGILLCCAALIAALSALYVVVWREPWLAARLRAFIRWMREPADVRSPYALAPDPVDEHFKQTPGGSIYVKSDHPADCARTCRGLRLGRP
jgi:hypothetical protein